MKRPSDIKCVKAKKTRLLSSSFRAITLFGTVYCVRKDDVRRINANDYVNCSLKNHEMIHVRQAEGTRNSWFLFYLKYLWQWICNLPLIFVNVGAPYKFIPFELEAYSNQDNWSHSNDVCYDWKKYKKLRLKDKRKFAKRYYNSRVYFTDFIKKNIDVIL